MAAKNAGGPAIKGPVSCAVVLAQIGAGDIKPVYLLYGEEDYLQEKLILTLGKAWLGDVVGAVNPGSEDGRNMTQTEAVDIAGQMTFFTDRKLVVIDEPAFIPVSGAKGGTSEGTDAEEPVKVKKPGPVTEQPLIAYIAQPAPGVCLVLRCRKGNPDRRHKLVMEITGRGALVEAAALSPGDRAPYLREALLDMGKRCAPGVMERIAGSKGGLSFCIRELEKAAAYAGEADTITSDMADAVLTVSPESNIFRLVDELGRRRRSEALHELRALLENGEQPFAVFAMMLRQFRLIFRAKACLQAGMGRTQIAQTLKVQPFVAENAAAQGKRFSFAELESVMELLCDCDLAMKSGVPYRQALEDIIIRVGKA
jgi:DNA polymerase-3 subunit delta